MNDKKNDLIYVMQYKGLAITGLFFASDKNKKFIQQL